MKTIMNPPDVPAQISRFPIIIRWVGLLSTLLLVIALACLYRSYQYDGSAVWPVSAGVITSNGLKTYLSKPNLAPSYQPVVTYSFTVDDLPRIGTRIDYADRVRTFHRAEAIAWLQENYPVGKPVKVYYQPGDPDTAVLVPGAKDLIFISYWMVGAGVICTVFSWGLYRLARRRAA